MGAGGETILNCDLNHNPAFSLNSAGTEKGGMGFDRSNTQITGYKDGKMEITAKKGVEVKGKIDMKDNSINQLKPGSLSKDSKDAVNGSQLFSTNENVSKNADGISKNTHSIENNYKELSGGIEKAKNDIDKVNGTLA
ncbi:MAG: hypothetical protein ACMX3H_14310 [Sodalis sp. (in: enterobacteria)]|uniref:hypothetical protein n=1 Tax=Sodalis sp. (in: enterobacteria) TaxID=1898979 RepID=UPI0039E6FFC0